MNLNTILDVINSAATLTSTAVKLVNDAQTVLSTGDRSQVQTALADLQSRNDDLSSAVRTTLAQAAKE